MARRADDESAEPDEEERPARSASIPSLVRPLLVGQRHRLAILAFTSIVGGLVEAALLVVLARSAFALASGDDNVTVDVPIVGTFHFTVSGLLGIGVGLVFVRMALNWTGVLMAARSALDVQIRLRRSLTQCYLRASWGLQSSQREGHLQQLISGFASTASGALANLAGLITSSFNLMALLAAALIVQPVAAVGAAVSALAIGLAMRPLRRIVRERARERAEVNLELATGVTEFAQTLQEVRIFGVQEPVAERIDGLAIKVNRAEMRSAYIGGAIPTLYQGTTMLLVIAALAVAYAADYSGLGSIGAIVLIMLRSLGYAQSLQGSVQALHNVAPYLERLQEEEDKYRAAAVPTGGETIDHIGVLEFDDVSFEYQPGIPVLKSVSFRMQPGEVIGIVGPSGAGKSTLVQLVLRLREPTKGALLVDGENAGKIDIESWYDHVTFVPQDPRLFAGSVADNIRFFRDVDQADIERAAKLSHIHDEIMAWPKGYDTPVGERGGQLSGGQRQRLCIARALVEEPDVVVLDEPTSALDVKSESLLRDTMVELAGRRTVIIIAHRLSTLSICDRIMVVLGGELQGFDDPATLEANNKFYAEALRLSGMR
jgi:ABC-type multidrug transport system fused ATPase/permease subunit